MERIVITGMGTISSVGSNTRETWTNVVAGRSGVGPITLFDASHLQVRIACEVKDFDPARYMDSKEARRRDRYEQLATAAAAEALTDSGLEVTEANAQRIGIVVSSAIGGLRSIQEAVETIANEGPRRVSPFLIPMLMANGASGLIAIDHGIKGPCLSIASACASGADGIGLAMTMIRANMIDVAIAGASESTVTSVGVAAFDRVGAMSRRNDD